ncbi:MAG: hypothetical protein KKI02_10345 [Planctomycetes bacterium]|nr:hypothetical protein [Planctomycetota bacterium]
MRLVDGLYDWLLQGPTPDCDRILGAALPHAEPVWAERMTRVLLQRGYDASWAGLIGQYDRLPPEIQDLLLHPDGHMQAGIALALRSSSREARVNALRALGRQPCVRMAYLLPLAIRDTSGVVRGLAAEALRQMADSFLEQPIPGPDAAEDLRRAYEDQRLQLALAVDEALQAFDLHNRIEVLEASLWLSRDLGPSLWSKLAARRSHAGLVVREQLSVWDDPRLAHFLLSGLKRRAWRRTSTRVLRGWKTIPQVAALLGEDHLLEDPTIRRHLSSIRSPQWFTRTDDGLTQLEPHLRRCAPRWVCYAGYAEPERLALLSRWLGAPDADLHSATVHVLARIDSPDARKLLGRVASGDSQLASFARWCVQAFDTEAIGASLTAQTQAPGRPDLSAETQRIRRQEVDADCTMLWLACRRCAANARGELITMLRENASVWDARLRSYLHSPNPRDRVLALHVISTQPLAQQFRADLRALQKDPVEVVRQLAWRLMQCLPRESAPDASLPRSVGRTAPADPQVFEQARHELQTALQRLSSSEADATDADLIARVRDLLREVYTEQFEPQPVAAPDEEG